MELHSIEGILSTLNQSNKFLTGIVSWCCKHLILTLEGCWVLVGAWEHSPTMIVKWSHLQMKYIVYPVRSCSYKLVYVIHSVNNFSCRHFPELSVSSHRRRQRSEQDRTQRRYNSWVGNPDRFCVMNTIVPEDWEYFSSLVELFSLRHQVVGSVRVLVEVVPWLSVIDVDLGVASSEHQSV